MRTKRSNIYRGCFLANVILITVLILPQIVAAAGEEIVVQTWGGPWGESFKNNVARPFEEKFGIKVITELQESSRIGMTKIIAQKDNPTVDVWTTIPGSVEPVAKLGILATVGEELIPNMANLYPYAKGKDSVGWYIAVRGIFYRKDLVPFEIKDYQDLWDPRLKNRIAAPDISYGGGQFLVICAILGGGSEFKIEPGFEMAKKLKPNIAMFFKSDSDAVKLVESGEAWALGRCLLPNAYKLLSEQPSKYGYAIPKKPLLVSLDQITLLKGKKLKLAANFVNYMLSPEAQVAHTTALGTFPVNRKARAVENIARISPPMDEIYKVNFDQVNSNLPNWTDWWNREMKTR